MNTSPHQFDIGKPQSRMKSSQKAAIRVSYEIYAASIKFSSRRCAYIETSQNQIEFASQRIEKSRSRIEQAIAGGEGGVGGRGGCA